MGRSSRSRSRRRCTFLVNNACRTLGSAGLFLEVHLPGRKEAAPACRLKPIGAVSTFVLAGGCDTLWLG